VPSLITSLCYL